MNLFRYSEEVKQELRTETENFAKIDREVQSIIGIASDKRRKNPDIILNFCRDEYEENTVLAKLQQVHIDLNQCQKGLNNFIAEKRKVFPRFYFLTMEELLDILANGNNPVMLFKEKNYMSKVVQAADKLMMKESDSKQDGFDRPTIISMNASVGKETVTFVRDLERVRAALGYEKVSLVGFSYGTQLGQVYANLRVHDATYPTPAELRSKIRWGNVEFEGDITKGTGVDAERISTVPRRT